MRVLFAGANGAIGRILLPLLLDAGHDIVATSRKPESLEKIRALGATPLQLDVFDAAAVDRGVAQAKPDIIMHQLTALNSGSSVDNALVRREGTRNLVDAAHRAGVERIIAQSIAWAYEPGDTPADESTPLDVAALEPRAMTISGVRALEHAVNELPHAVILRYGTLYGPGTWYRTGGLMAGRLGRSELPANGAVTSFLHVEDAARSAVAALQWMNGSITANIVDDEPAPAREWAPALARVLGAPAPVQSYGRANWERGADNSFARTELDWQPVYPSWRIGFAELNQ